MDTPDFDRVTRDLLRALRGERSQLAFSQLLGHRGNVSYRWEAGLRQPTAQALFTILDVLDIDPSDPGLDREIHHDARGAVSLDDIDQLDIGLLEDDDLLETEMAPKPQSPPPEDG